MPKHWITMHWPHPLDDKLPWDVYLKTQSRGKNLEIGDQILFYESVPVKGLTTAIERISNSVEHVPLGPGRKGIVAVGEVAGTLQKHKSIYDYGNGEDWQWVAKCHKQRFGNVVPYQDMLEVLEMSPHTPGYVFGLRRIEKEEFDELVRMLKPIG